MQKPTMDRREFVGATLAAAAGALQSTRVAFSEPQKKPGMKVGLYSITFLGLWYRGEALKLEEVIQRAKQYGYDGIEIDGKRPHGNPIDMPTARCRELRPMREIGYSGYLSYELCHPLPKVGGQTVGIDYAEKSAQLAAEFMRGLLNATAA